VDTTATTASLQYLVTPQFYLTGTGGYESYNYASIVPETGGASYTAGFSWKPTARTSITASAGRRFFGRTFALESSVRSRATVWQISYNEDITTAQSQAAIPTSVSTSDFLNQLFMSSIPDAAARQEAVDRFIATTGLSPTLPQSNNFFSNQFFLQKNLRASAAFTGAKNTVVFGLFNTRREAQTALPETGLGGALGTGLNANTRQTGADLLWSWRLTPVTSANLNASYSRTRELSTDALQITRLARIALTRRLKTNLDATIELRRQMQNSSVPEGSYVENAVSALVSMKF
jgi:uncharacterized protein (PEP-CTERM system associated)